ncbi:MAG: alpha/beta hydrolase family protein [Eubacteriaceae bacterium]|jgi:acetyl esterase/lipase
MNKIRKIQYGSSSSQFGILSLPEIPGPYPVIVMIHGGFWKMPYDLNGISQLCTDLNRRGYAVWNIEYRRVGEPGGGYPGTMTDALDAVNYLNELERNHPLDLTRTVIMGHSAGGQVALWTGSCMNHNRSESQNRVESQNQLEIPILGIISMAGVCDLEEMWKLDSLTGPENHTAELIGGSPDKFPERYQAVSPIALLPLKVPQILFHGKADYDVPPQISIAYYQAGLACGDTVSLNLLPHTDHFTFLDPSSHAWQSVTASLDQLTKES